MKPGSTSNGSSASAARSAPRSTQGRGSGGEGEIARWFDQSVCVFWLGDQCFGLATALVGEVFVVESYALVPVAPPAIIGLFNLRGAPVALVDLAMVLELPGAGLAVPAAGATLLALVLRAGGLLVGAHIRKMEVVVPAGRGLYTPPEGSAEEHPVVAGFLELPERPELTITLLHPEALAARLNRLRFLESDEPA